MHIKAGRASTRTLRAIFVGACAFACLESLSIVSNNLIRGVNIQNSTDGNPRHGLGPRSNQHVNHSSACDFFLARSKFDDTSCNITLALKQSAAASLSGGCVPQQTRDRGCRQPDILTTHTWVTELNVDDSSAMQRLSLLLRAWMLTQDLKRSRFILWALRVWPSIGDASSRPWMRQFAPYITLRHFDYGSEVATTPLSLSQHFNSWEIFANSTANMPSLQSDVFRNIILFNYGGLWLDTDSVPLRDLWDITAGVGLQFIPKFKGFIANGHIMYVSCPKSDLARRRLEHITMFPKDHDKAWPRQPSAGGPHWIFNDALSEYVQASQALKYNLSSRDGEEIDRGRVPGDAWSDVEVPFPITWFDNWWVCSKLTETNNTDFAKTTSCNGTYIWHRLTKHTRGDPRTWGPYSGGDGFWDEIYGGSVYDHTSIRDHWPLGPRVLTGGVECDV